MTKKDFTEDEIITAIACGLSRSREKNSDNYIKTIIDESGVHTEPKNSDVKKMKDETAEMLKKMFGDLFNE